MEGIDETFQALTGHPRPLRWQRRLLERLVAGEVPAALDLPTGLGKTSVMALWLMALAIQMRDGGRPLLPRRLVYVVDRRAVVDQATAEVERLVANLRSAPSLAWMRAALGLGEGGELPVSTLRGKRADNRAWLADPAMPAVIVGTVDMTGSRLLFSGYGVSRGMRPVHAAMLAVDTLFALDEAHLVPAFQKLLEQIAATDDRLWPERGIIRPLQVLPLSATGEARASAFVLTANDEADEVVVRRLHAAKRLELRPFDSEGKKEALVDALAEAAWTLAFDADDAVRTAGRVPPRAMRVLVYADSREVAQKVAAALQKWAKGVKRFDPPRAVVELFTGARRVKEREEAAERLERLGFLAGQREDEETRETPVFLVATSAAEVGVDLDADAMAGDLVALERMIQRFGRVNRLGEVAESPVVVLVDEKALKGGKDEEREARLQAVVQALERLGGDASPAALLRLREAAPDLVQAASTPMPLYPPLEPATVEAWALTSMRAHTGRPDITPWLRGWVKEAPQATIIWREHLPWREGEDRPLKSEVEAFFRVARPHLLEMVEAEAAHVADVLIRCAKRWQKALEKGARRRSEAQETAGEEAALQPAPALIALSPAGDMEGAWTVEDLAAEKTATLVPRIAGRLLVADSDLGGLDAAGLLSRDAAGPVSTADAGWGVDWQESVGFRVHLRERQPIAEAAEVKDIQSAAEAGGRLSGGEEAASPWREAFVLVLARDGDGVPVKELVVQVLRRQAGDDAGDPAIARVDYPLKAHLQDVAEEAKALAVRLGLPEALGRILQVAGAWHDVGKNRLLWQEAANAPVQPERRRVDVLAIDGAYAKTKGPFRQQLLGGYRHELGSLLDMEERQDGWLNGLSEEGQQLVRHLVVAHHGHARPSIPAVDPAHAPRELKAKVAEVALRFARLQERYGPWGLAWLEALLRAADRRASAMLEATGMGKAAPRALSHGTQGVHDSREVRHG